MVTGEGAAFPGDTPETLRPRIPGDGEPAAGRLPVRASPRPPFALVESAALARNGASRVVRPSGCCGTPLPVLPCGRRSRTAASIVA